MKILKIFGGKPVVNVMTESLPGAGTYEKLMESKAKISDWAKKHHVKEIEIDNFHKESNEIEDDSASLEKFFSSTIKINLKERFNKKYELWMKFPFDNQGSFISKFFDKLNNYKNDHVIVKKHKA